MVRALSAKQLKQILTCFRRYISSASYLLFIKFILHRRNGLRN